MSFKTLISNDCCLLTDINLNSFRIYHLLQRRFKNNSTKTSFDFKSFLPEQPSNNTKVSRSFLRVQPKLTHIDDYEDNVSVSDAASCSSEDEHNKISSTDDDDDDNGENDRLKVLYEWNSEHPRPTTDVDDDDEDENEHVFQSTSTENNEEDNAINSMDVSPAEEALVNLTEDLLITYSVKPIKIEPISDGEDDVFDNIPQLDGHTDLQSSKSDPNNKKKLDETIAKIVANKPKPSKTIQLHQIPITPTRFRLNDDTKKKPINKTRTGSISKVDRTKKMKPKLKTKPQLLTSLLKTNEDVIRPLQTSIPKNNQKPFRLPSDSRPLSVKPNVQVPRKSFSIDERITAQQQKNTSLFLNKQKSLPQTIVKPKEKSASDHMKLAAKKLKHQQSKPTSSTLLSTKPKPKDGIKNPLKFSKSKDSAIPKVQSTLKVLPSNGQLTQKKPKRLDNQKSTGNVSSSSVAKTPPPPSTDQQSEPTNSDNKTSKRPSNFFDGCITIDDDDDDDDNDIQEIERQHYSIAHNIRSREKLLDHIVHSSVMHVKWLFNLDYILLEHISICHENNIRPLNIKNEFPSQSLIYKIDPSFISTIIINFLKLFILRNSSYDQQHVSFIQFGLTSHLRYLLIELPTYNHNEENDCSKCRQYSLIINILFDLLFDLIEHDLCEINSKIKYRSSLIEDDYFAQFSQIKFTHKDSFYRIKFLIYFIELIGIHMNKCSNKNPFQFNKNENKLFHSIEDFIRHILSHNFNSMNQRISICFNVMELCILFVNEKEIRIKQMALFLLELCENNSNYLNLFLMEKNLLPDIRLLLINELISKKFNSKLISIDHIQQFFNQIQNNFNSINSIDEFVLLLLRSLFNTYADLILELKEYSLVYSKFIEDIRLLLHNQLKLIFDKLIEISDKGPEYFQKIKSTLFLYRLLRCKWNQL